MNSLNVRPWPELQLLIPPLSTRERKQLSDSIASDGVLVPIIVLSDGRIIDGHHRWELSGENAPITIQDVTEGEGMALGITLNLARRHMSPEQITQIHNTLRQQKELRRKVAVALRQQGKTQTEVAAAIGVSQPTIVAWEKEIIRTDNPSPDVRISVPQREYETIYERDKKGESRAQIAADHKVTPRRIGQIVGVVEARKREPMPVPTDIPFPQKRYQCIVIDPPWPVQKIEREVRPNQGKRLDYPVMSLEEIEALPISDLANATGCHVYLWVTQKYLPNGLHLFEQWGVKYQCTMTWVKPTGFTPFSWMYNTEHVLFGRIGSLKLETLGLKLSFSAPITRHSEKPSVFYDRVLKASPGPRLEMFARQSREGFDTWGNEVADLASL